MLIAVAERALEENREYMDAAYASDGDVETKLRCMATAYARFAKARPHQFRILVEPPNEPEALAQHCCPDQTAKRQIGRIDQPRYRRRVGACRRRAGARLDGVVGNDEWRYQPDVAPPIAFDWMSITSTIDCVPRSHC
ncbi:hypothetical protein [Burkholderia contaminans]|uniref:hypothetical protein n=1 Tax=Burkholderia contaminans TaxID=488447 RepID=UPI001FC7E37D|nr:hypothetical protein [Burkholderia contaminans]